MAYIGKVPTAVPLTTSDLADGIVTVSKLATTLDLSSNTITLPSGVGGKVLQVQANDNSSLGQVSSNTNSLVDVSGMDVILTPSSISSKVIIWVCANMGSGNNLHQFAISLSSIIGGTQTTIDSQYETLATKNDTSWITNIYKHSPSTTSEITYRLQFKSFSSNIVYFNRRSLRIVAEEYSS